MSRAVQEDGLNASIIQLQLGENELLCNKNLQKKW